jgi:putative endonuclease
MHTRALLGRTGETLVEHYLQGQGFIILERNYSRKYGEIDLIATTHDVISFVEVKMRSNPRFDMSEVVTFAKQQKIIAVAKAYLALYPQDTKVCRFDVALIDISAKNPITYIENAFQEPY